ncbi:uncharacterized protein LOC135684295 isoform X2 [Rhopilema esculentum]|uniref:uncharacterized protein LOC135684295 isoform X2 n=1 Tax=Rhopilema esculentum TaxID=499914 RepID=UPI0031E01004
MQFSIIKRWRCSLIQKRKTLAEKKTGIKIKLSCESYLIKEEMDAVSTTHDYQQSEHPKANDPADCLASLQVLTSSISSVPKPPVIDVKKGVKPSTKRGRKKKLPLKVSQKPILPKVFAIQISPQSSVIAKNVVTPVSYHITGASGVQIAKTVSLDRAQGPKVQEIGGRKVQDEGTHHGSIFAENRGQQFESGGFVMRSGGLQRGNRKRLVHNAAEKKRKERINGWISKIASVLFKYYPEKQHKIYILEKAYDFIAEKTQLHQEEKERQDAYTQSDARQESTVQELVCKIADLENLVDVLLKVMRKYKIPAPSSLFNSTYVKAKFDFLNPGTVSVGQVDENGILLNKYSSSASDQQHLIPCSTGNSSFPSDQMIIELNEPHMESNSNATLSIQTHVPNEEQETLTVVSESLNLASASSTQASFPVAETYMSVTKKPIISGREAVAATLGSVFSTDQPIAVDQNGQVAMVSHSRLILPADLPLLNASSVTRTRCINKSTLAEHMTEKGSSLSNDYSVAVDSAIHVNSNNAGNISKQAMPDCMTATSCNAENKRTNKDTVSKAPSMESQMFVIKNLVQPKTKAVLNGNALSFITSGPMPVLENNEDSSVSAATSKNVYLPRTHCDTSALSSNRSIVSMPVIAGSGERLLQSDLNGISAITSSFVRIENASAISSQQLYLARSSHTNVVTKNVGPQIVSAVGNVVTQVVNKTQRSQTVHCASEGDKNISIPVPCQQDGSAASQVGVTSTQTCHTVTSLLGNVVTSPTENSALSIEAILADRPKIQQKIVSQHTQNNKRVKQVEPKGQPPSSSAISKAETTSRKRLSSSKSQTRQLTTQSSMSSIRSAGLHNTFSLAKPPAKRLRKSTNQNQGRNEVDFDIVSSTVQSSATIFNTKASLNMVRVEESPPTRRQTGKINDNASKSIQSRSGLPKAHNFVSLAKRDPRGESNINNNSNLGHFSAESLLRSNNPSNTQVFSGDTEQDGNLPTILNIFSPASVGNMVTQLPLSNSKNPQHLTNNSNLPTIQSTFSNFSAETLIGGTIENQSVNSVVNPNDGTLVQQEQQNLFTDFSTDALLAGTESSLSYGIDNIMSRNDVVTSSSCISPSWLQTGAFIDSSPIRGNFNPGFSFLDTPNGPQGYPASGQAANFSTPIKWRPDVLRNDDQIYNNMPSSIPVAGPWSQNIMTTPQKTARGTQAKDGQRNKVSKSQSSNKRGPSFGDFLLVDSVS